MDRILKNVLILTAVLFTVLTARLYYLAAIKSEELKQNFANKRNLIAVLNAPRGKILASDGTIIAMDLKSDKKIRVYPFREKMAHLTGYFSARYGASGAELSFNRILSADTAETFWKDSTRKEGNVKLSIDTDLQLKAYSLLNQKGALAAVEVKTGKLLCLVSYPSFDPNRIDEDFETIRRNPDAPLVNRVLSGVYPPGSTIKILTLAAYLEEGGNLNETFEAPAVYKVGGFRITNYDHRNFRTISLIDAFKYSVNTVFAQVGLKLGLRR
jgi:peptidoglycan glycosyltransferase